MFKKNENKPKKKRKVWKVVAVLAGVVIVFNLVSGIFFTDAESMLPMVDTVEVVKGDVTSTLETSGTIASELIQVYASPVSAQVGDVAVTVGQSVKAGDFLLSYDTTSLQKSYDIAELQAKADAATSNDVLTKSNEGEADLNTSNSDIQTLTSMEATINGEIASLQTKASDTKNKKKEAASIQAQLAQKTSQLAEVQRLLAEAQSKKASAEAGILSASQKENINLSQQASKLTLEQSAENLSAAKAGITAEFDGIVTDVQAEAGTMAAEGAGLISVASAKDMCVEMSVSKYNLSSLALNQKATITFQEKEYDGTVNYISKMATTGESGAAMVKVKVHIENPDDALILGLDAKVSVDLGTASDVWMVPIAAVNSDSDGDFVYLLKEGIVEKQYVTTGLTSKENVEIKTGLESGDKIITTIDATVVEGAAVMENVPQEDTENEAETTEKENGISLEVERVEE